ncbi:family 43 glycosylhydrolase [Plebeiibacterium sediminum]|uniref:Family 43 glycosylhydrolase n=1 Tax=Plebeiibacterium sediminum TaxID=2992112 RepID=A0AAE3SF40_9BACT|nr:family 43 glycosylhydrolase [Plebeiobacterium sediminum]MCW3786632.1 family 43 glycosylhydrolase [Plebeiobacterium sediminum]
MKHYFIGILWCILVISSSHSFAQNPIIKNLYTADPSARVFNGRVYLFPSHDVANMGKGRENWFCMEDYHVFSSENLTEWTDHGVIVHQKDVPWTNPESYSMWAPDCIYRNGKYYFYFPTINKNNTAQRSFGVGVAIADAPEGPYSIMEQPIKGVHGIDPNVFIDKDNQAYLYWSSRDIFVAKLKDNMVELDSDPITIANLPTKGLKEGPYFFERNGLYYLTYPHVENNIERLEYAIGKTPTGPFEVKGVIMDESPTGCWTNHHSIIEYNNQWYLFYHHNDYSPDFDKNRSARIDSLFFKEDGSIVKVKPTLRGVGISKASENLQIDRYSDISKSGVSIDFIDTNNTFKGWKAQLLSKDAWIKYNSVAFDIENLSKVIVNAQSAVGGIIEIRLDNPQGKVIASINIPANKEWKIYEAPLAIIPKEREDLVILLKSNREVEIDWIKFK